ncbi:MAG: gfo/Idh/MocA family oxidoreductase, partial [Phycisphaeraceae bacterium]
MEIRRLGIILNGVTGRMGTNQHLVRSILAIIQQGGVKVSDDLTLMPDPILTGRNANKLKALAEKYGPDVIGKPLKYSTDVDAVIKDEQYPIFFDASSTLLRAKFIEKAAAAGKAIYCEKP